MARLSNHLSAWLFLAGLIALADGEWPSSAFHGLYVVLLLISWRWLPRRMVPLFTAILMVLAVIPGVVVLIRPGFPSFGDHFGRTWTTLSLAAAGLWFARQQIVRQRRVQMRRQLHARVVRRTAQLRRANRRLLDEMHVRESTERRLVESEMHLESLIDHLALHVIRKDRNGIFTYASQSFCELLGRSSEEVIGHKDTEFYPPLSAAKYRQDDLRVMTTRQVIDTIEVNPHPDGSRSYVQVLKAPEINAAGDVVGVQAVFWDVTARQQSEVELRRSEARKRALFEAVGDGILLVDPQGRIVEANPSVEELFRLPMQDVIGRRLKDLARPAEPGAAGLWPPQGLTQRCEIDLVRSDGEPLAAEAVAHPIPLDDAPGWAIVVRDITLRRAAARALEAAKNAAEAANQAKSRFVAGVSHELRTPLGAMMGVSQLLSDTALNPIQQQYVMLLGQAAEMLNGVIDDLLDFSKIEADRLHLESHPFDLVEAIGTAVKCLGPKASAKQLKLLLDIDPRLPSRAIGDSLRLRQVVMNLVGNAIKFTEQGYVLVRLRQTDGQHEDGLRLSLDLEVVDTGIGIPEERQAAIFDAFEQADSSTTRRFGGTGLGLAITDRIVRLMGGTIEVFSRSGEGSTFRVKLSLVRDPDEPRTAEGQATGSANADHSASVLILGFDEPEQTALAHVAARAGLLAESAPSAGGPTRAEPLPSAVLAPFGQALPAKLRSVRTLWVAPSPTPASQAHETVLVYPVLHTEILLALQAASADIRSHEAAATSAPMPAVQASEQPSQGRAILLADDSPLNRAVIGDLLRAAGFQVSLAEDGRQALQLAQQGAFDVILMDLQMPELDGLQAAMQIRERLTEQARRLPPIIALTAHVTDEYREQCLQAGLSKYVTKPVRRSELLSAIEISLAENGSRQTDSEIESDAESPPPSDHLPPWLGRLVARLGMPIDQSSSAAGLVRTELQQQADLITAAEANGDFKGLRRGAHTLKSAFGYLESEEAARSASRLENAAERGDASSCRHDVPEVLQWVSHWLAELSPYLATPLASGDPR